MPGKNLKCPQCESAASTTDEFCSVCGQAFLSICPQCDHDVSVWNDICAYCGRAVNHHLDKLHEKGSEDETRELQRLQAEEKTLSERLEHPTGNNGIVLLKNIVFACVELGMIFGAIWLALVKVFPNFEESFNEYRELWPLYVNIALVVAGLAVLYFVYGIVARHAKAILEGLRRNKTTLSSLQNRLKATRKRIEMIKSREG